MKKLMVALAAIAMAAGVQASTVQWNYAGDIVDYNWDTSSYVTENNWVGSADAYILFLGDSGTFKVAADGSVTLGGGATEVLTGSVADGMAEFSKSTATQNGVYTLLVVETGTGEAWYGSTTATASGWVADPTDAKTLEFAVADSNFDSGYAPLKLSQHVTEDVPEPTSGLLLLLGLSGLALRRRRA